MRTSSPTIIDAYQTAFLQCVVKSHNRPIDVFWVIGDSSVNSVLITDYLTTNKYMGDRLRRIFPLSLFDYSIELSVNRTQPERVYSCVIKDSTTLETTLFTYIVRTIDLEEIGNETLNRVHKEGKIAANDTLNSEQILSLRENQKAAHEEENISKEDSPEHEDDQEHTEETSTKI